MNSNSRSKRDQHYGDDELRNFLNNRFSTFLSISIRFIHSLTLSHMYAHARSRTFCISHFFSSYFVSPRFCIYDVLKSGYFSSVLFLLTMSAFSFIWMLLLLRFFCCCILRMHFPFSPSSCRLNPFTSSFSSASSKCWLLKLSLTFQFLPPPQHSIILIHCGSKLSTLVQSHIPLRFWFYFGMFYIAPVNNPKSIIYKSPIYNNQTKKAWSEKREREREGAREGERERKSKKYMSTANRVEKFVGRSCPNGKVDADK